MKLRIKAQREAAQKAALRKRLFDIAIGANGYELYAAEDHGELVAEMGIECFSRFLTACKFAFELNDDTEGAHREWLIRPNTLKHWESLDTATEFLYEHGVRA